MNRPHVVIIGGGFAGLHTARYLNSKYCDITLIDKRNFHLFQPLLYQVATGGLSPAEISAPLRSILKKQKNTQVLLEEVIDILPKKQQISLKGGKNISYDYLVVATGVRHHYFGHPEWEKFAPGLKTVEDATMLRSRILMTFEEAERNQKSAGGPLTFVLVGGGATGVEMAGTIAELAHQTLKGEFKHIDPAQTKIILIEGLNRILPTYPKDLSQKSKWALEKLGVTVFTETNVKEVNAQGVRCVINGKSEFIPASLVFWAAGVQASPLGKIIAERTRANLDQKNCIVVENDCSVYGYPNLFVIGDLAHFDQDGKPLPGMAPIAIQQGKYVATRISKRIQGRGIKPFRYIDRGKLAVIGRAAAVVDLMSIRFSGYLAWLLWLFIHLLYLVGFRNRLIVLIQWAWSYITRNRGARLITRS